MCTQNITVSPIVFTMTSQLEHNRWKNINAIHQQGSWCQVPNDHTHKDILNLFFLRVFSFGAAFRHLLKVIFKNTLVWPIILRKTTIIDN